MNLTKKNWRKSFVNTALNITSDGQSPSSHTSDQGKFALDYRSIVFRNTLLVHADCLEWMGRVEAESIHAIVTDPPYGVKEYNFDQIKKRANGNGGIWRIPP